MLAAGQHGRPGRGRFEGIPPLLLRAIRAQPSLRYKGAYTTEFRQGPASIRHQEYITREGDRYRIDFPNDSQFAGQVIIENSRERLHYHPITNEIVQQPPRHGEVWERIANLANNRKFVLTTVPGELIAGMRTEELVVSDRAGNLVQRLYIEPISGLIMKRQLFDFVGTQIGYFEFTEVALNPKIEPDTFVIKRRDARVITPRIQLERLCRRRGFHVVFLPPSSGYKLEGASPRNFAGTDGLVQSYLNGNERLWVYDLKGPINANRLRQNAGRDLHVHSFELNGETIVLMAKIDEQTLARFATLMESGTPARQR